jgi:hypothetical protein
MMDTEVMAAVKGQTMDAARASMGADVTAPHAFAKAEFEEDSVAEEKT